MVKSQRKEETLREKWEKTGEERLGLKKID